jgi:hypothetical protein
VSLKFGRPVGLKAAQNPQSPMGLVLTNTTPFAIVDFRRFEPAGRPNFKLTWVYLKTMYLLFIVALLSLAGCADTGYQSSYIISHTEEEPDPEVVP